MTDDYLLDVLRRCWTLASEHDPELAAELAVVGKFLATADGIRGERMADGPDADHAPALPLDGEEAP